MKTAIKLDTQQKESLLATLAKQGLMKQKIADVSGSGIYAVTVGWQITYLKDSNHVAEAQDSEGFESAAQDANIGAIFVPRAAAMTREIAERILTRNGQPKTVFLEV
ncbi:MAG: hypothetical protein KGI29_05630 [Pseudomonadota bacterium]|nr:hypothetical protein [Pseudomonadota bacterium]MDE3037715.1 hypothetical protein [Pseudomonadota bacterium]